MRLLPCLILIASTTTALASPPAGVLGDWKTNTGSIVRVAPCGNSVRSQDQPVCLSVVKLAPSAPETTDQQNPDSALRNRPLCGLTVGTGFRRLDADHLADGHLYDPKSGHTYRGTITVAGDELLLHGYIGISLFGRSETWHRVPTLTAVCR